MPKKKQKPKIIHFGFLKKTGGMSYICNFACSITPEKIANKPEEVTCKNCLKSMVKPK